jgi:hypothetical protein
MDALKPEIARLFTAKQARRHKLAGLPFPEKVRAVVCLQEMVAPVLRARVEECVCGSSTTAHEHRHAELVNGESKISNKQLRSSNKLNNAPT